MDFKESALNNGQMRKQPTAEENGENFLEKEEFELGFEGVS